jgi:hypothetical protein
MAGHRAREPERVRVGDGESEKDGQAKREMMTSPTKPVNSVQPAGDSSFFKGPWGGKIPSEPVKTSNLSS